ncbi:MAG: IclR family transcriptional regulator [Candidatus Competibacteraceae bacterium]
MPSSIQVIARVSRLLDALAAHDEPISLKALSIETGLHPSTTFRILASLIEHGLAERSVTGHYRLGIRLLRLGNRVYGQLDIRREAQPIMEQLRDQIDETVNLGIREGDEMVYVERATAPRLMRVEPPIEARTPRTLPPSVNCFWQRRGVAACHEYAIRTGLPACNAAFHHRAESPVAGYPQHTTPRLCAG